MTRPWHLQCSLRAYLFGLCYFMHITNRKPLLTKHGSPSKMVVNDHAGAPTVQKQKNQLCTLSDGMWKSTQHTVKKCSVEQAR